MNLGDDAPVARSLAEVLFYGLAVYPVVLSIVWIANPEL